MHLVLCPDPGVRAVVTARPPLVCPGLRTPRAHAPAPALHRRPPPPPDNPPSSSGRWRPLESPQRWHQPPCLPAGVRVLLDRVVGPAALVRDAALGVPLPLPLLFTLLLCLRSRQRPQPLLPLLHLRSRRRPRLLLLLPLLHLLVQAPMQCLPPNASMGVLAPRARPAPPVRQRLALTVETRSPAWAL